MKKRLGFLLLIIFFISSCRSLGSWYIMSPPPVDQIDISKMDDLPYLAERIRFNNMTFDMIIINPEKIPLEILNSPDNRGLSFSKLQDRVAPDKLLFAVNGGMYQEDRKPLGYFSKNGVEMYPLNTYDGYGNFYLKPNGVFFINKGKAGIEETETFSRLILHKEMVPQLATQSGPLLLKNGEIHTEFTKGSTNKYVRNGVGIIKRDKTDLIAFVISDRPVNFYDLSLFFRDFLHCEDALYLDGHISAMYLPSLNRNQSGGSFGTVLYSME